MGRAADGEKDALQSFYQTYRYPVYVFLRRLGETAENADDLTQMLFLKFIQGESLGTLDQNKGRLRDWLKTAARRMQIDEVRRRQSGRNGGGCTPISLEGIEAENRFQIEDFGADSPEDAFDRKVAAQTLDLAIKRLRVEVAGKRGADRLTPLLGLALGVDSEARSYAEIATATGRTEGAVKIDVLRLRKRLKDLFLEEVRLSVSSNADAEDEVRFLLGVLQR
ncbi:MAG: sigma-70 family RNA polymerase sigma factor [Verrucomicrobiales bacterium]|nr:sigma-70 family RNA polymerase sigma factor [Verrucomicrobiales bacterium]